MREANGDFLMAAEALGRSESALRAYVARDQQLSALWIRDPSQVKTPDEGDLMNRTIENTGIQPVPKLDGNPLGEAALRMNREVLRTGLQAAGIRAETINKLSLFESFSENTGAFLAAGLDITHKLMMYQGIALFEEAEAIKKLYLQNETLPMDMKLEWARVYTEMSEQVGKTSDRMLVATQAAIAMLKKKEEQDGGGGKQKPGFAPLKKAQPAE